MIRAAAGDRSLGASILLNITNYLTPGNADFALRMIMGFAAVAASIAACLYYREAWKQKKAERIRREKLESTK